MKKYYIIFGTTIGVFVFGIIVLMLNPDSELIPANRRAVSIVDYVPETTRAGDIAINIAIGLIALALVARFAYLLYKYIRKLILKIRGKKDSRNYTPDSAELYTHKQSSENLSKWMISVKSGGLLDKDADNTNKKK